MILITLEFLLRVAFKFYIVRHDSRPKNWPVGRTLHTKFGTQTLQRDIKTSHMILIPLEFLLSRFQVLNSKT
jgi:hypothetical protein